MAIRGVWAALLPPLPSLDLTSCLLLGMDQHVRGPLARDMVPEQDDTHAQRGQTGRRHVATETAILGVPRPGAKGLPAPQGTWGSAQVPPS